MRNQHLFSLTDDQLNLVEDQLSNNEDVSEEEIVAFFIENGLTQTQACSVMAYRERYRKNVYQRPFTPLSKERNIHVFNVWTGNIDIFNK